MIRRAVLAAMVVIIPTIAAAQSRLASDFEIAQMRAQIERSSDFLSRLSGHLNLGDLHATRSETEIARREYGRALSIAADERLRARRDSDLSRYATTTAYAALANAKLQRPREAFALLEEAIRYSSDSAKTWNLYSTAMTVLGRAQKSVPAAWNAVAIATADVQRAPSIASRLDLAIYQYSLATALIETGHEAEAERLLRTAIDSLRGDAFEPLRRQIERSESFEIYSTARGEAAAYLSVMNRAQLRLGALLEKRGDAAAARDVYTNVLDARSDDANALAALARLSDAAERARYFAAAFDANPFALSLVRAYQRHLVAGGSDMEDPSTTGGAVRLALAQMHRGETRPARNTLDDLLRRFPGNATLQLLRRELDAGARAPEFLSQSATEVVDPSAADLRRLAALEAATLTPQQRAALDAITFTSTATFSGAGPAAPGQTTLEQGAIAGVPFRFAEPTTFAGTFPADEPLRLTYRILGATEFDGADALLLEPLRVEVIR